MPNEVHPAPRLARFAVGDRVRYIAQGEPGEPGTIRALKNWSVPGGEVTYLVEWDDNGVHDTDPEYDEESTVYGDSDLAYIPQHPDAAWQWETVIRDIGVSVVDLASQETSDDRKRHRLEAHILDRVRWLLAGTP